jgi:uncharacterized protein YegP (UPF0339 family)
MFEIYRSTDKEFRWRFLATNGRVLADSGEGYAKRSAAIRAVDRIKALIPGARVVENLG